MFQYAATRGIAAARGYDFIIPDDAVKEQMKSLNFDEEQQHKLFMAFNMTGAKNIGLLEAGYRKEEHLLDLIKILLMSVLIM